MAVPIAATLLASFTASAAADSFRTQQYSWYKNYYPQVEAYCFYGCYNAVNHITFNYTPVSTDPNDWLLNRCSDSLKLISMMYCAQKYCSSSEATAGRNFLAPDCEKIGRHFPTAEETLLSPADLDNIMVLKYGAGMATAKVPGGLGVAAIPDVDWHDLEVRTVSTFYTNWSMSFDFTFALIGFWAVVVGVGILGRIIASKKQPLEKSAPSSWLWIRRQLILPATFGQKQAEAVAYAGTIPPRFETLLLAIYVMINVYVCFPGYHVFVGNQWYAEEKVQLARYVGDRTGFLSIAQLPLVWIFAARNDPLLWLTGWSYATFNRFHRWLARISVLHAVIHSIAYSIFAVMTSTYSASWTARYWWCGGIATTGMCLMLGLSAYYFREKCYDLFLPVHILMALVVFVTLWYHVRIFNGEFNYYMYPCIAIWLLDRLLRIGRTMALSIIPRLTRGVKATVTYNHDADMIRLDVTDFFPNTKIVPGLYYFLYIPGNLRAYESHPMTMCSWRRPMDSPSSSPTASPSEKGSKPMVRRPADDYTRGETAHTLLIRPYQGMTGRLLKKISSDKTSPTSAHEMLLSADELIASPKHTVFLEGPYGTKLDLSGYSEVLLVCGGSGITAAISHVYSLMDKNDTTRVFISWAVPDHHLPDNICANELAAAMQSNRVRMTVYLTSTVENGAHDAKGPPIDPSYEICFGRPDIAGIMRRHRKLATKSLGIVTCGTPQLSDVCRAAVVDLLSEEGVEVGYYNESMMW